MAGKNIMKYKDTDGVINYEEIDCGKPVIILHGLGCDLNMMKTCLEPVFAKKPDYKRVYVDLPGMGKLSADR